MSFSIYLSCFAAVIVAIILMFVGKNSSSQSGKERKMKEMHVEPVSKKREKPIVKEDPAVTEAKKDLYQYVNQCLRKMFQHFRKNKWEQLTVFGAPSEQVKKQYGNIIKTLPEQSKELVEQLFSCIDLAGKEEVEPGTVTDSKKLKEVFLKMMLPFYPVYYKELDGIRYSALLNKETLDLFHKLTGKKYRMGYKNRYATGVISYEWKKEVFRVYDEKGTLLCDASFKNGQIENGYAVVKVKDCGEKDWDVYKKGTWKDGNFEDGVLQYIYKKPCC